MNGKRLAVASVVAAAALALFASPVLAQGADSITEQLISGLNARLLAVAIPITLVVEGILFYTVWKYKDNDEPQPTKENRRLEITWTVATAVVLLFVGVASYSVMANPNVIATEESLPATGDAAGAGDATADPVVVEATGVQWFWRFHYPEHNVSTQDEMVIPTDRPVVIKTQSSDVVHSFHVPALSLKSDSLPGQWNYIRTEVYEPGTYRLYCAEYCGTGHSQMLGNVTAMPEDDYESWLDEQRQSDGGNETADGNATAGGNAMADGYGPADGAAVAAV